jgi:hypothetical protein
LNSFQYYSLPRGILRKTHEIWISEINYEFFFVLFPTHAK